MLTVLNDAYPLAPVDEDPVGGAEQVLAALDRALVRAGHRSAVVEMASAIGAVGELRAGDCRAAAEARFSADEMTRRHFALDTQAVEGARGRRSSRPSEDRP